MKLEPPVEVSRDKITLDVSEIEPLLQAPPMDIKPWPGATITLKDGRTMYIREARLEEAPAMMEYISKVMQAKHDFYDVVGARVYAELAGWYRKRLKDPYTLVGLIDGMWAGFANGRLMNEDINISLIRWPSYVVAGLAPLCTMPKPTTALKFWAIKSGGLLTKATTAGGAGASEWLSPVIPGPSTSTS